MNRPVTRARACAALVTASCLATVLVAAASAPRAHAAPAAAVASAAATLPPPLVVLAADDANELARESELAEEVAAWEEPAEVAVEELLEPVAWEEPADMELEELPELEPPGSGDSNAPRSGAAPWNGRPTSTPALMAGLPTWRLRSDGWETNLGLATSDVAAPSGAVAPPPK